MMRIGTLRSRAVVSGSRMFRSFAIAFKPSVEDVALHEYETRSPESGLRCPRAIPIAKRVIAGIRDHKPLDNTPRIGCAGAVENVVIDDSGSAAVLIAPAHAPFPLVVELK